MLKIAFHKDYFHPVPNGHRFPMEKYELLPQQLIYEGTVTEEAFFEPGMIDKELLLAVHTEQYVEDLLSLQIDPKDQRKTGFIHSEQLIRREQIIMEGTRKAAEYDNTNDEARQKTVLKVYPNPSDKGFTIEFPEMNGSYIITNTNGKIVNENRVLTQTIFIELPKGIYVVKWINTNGIQTQKIIAL